VNPRGESRRWERFNVVPQASTEIELLKDIDGDGKPEVLFTGPGAVMAYAKPDPANPTAVWKVHNISEPGLAAPHGMGVGDISGDGRMDVVNNRGWWEQPASGAAEGLWKFHPAQFGNGGAEMGVYDVNGDGLNDVVTAIAAHQWGLAWFEQKRDAQGNITFVRHDIMGDFSAKNAGGVVFSEPHAAAFADMDGDGVPHYTVGVDVRDFAATSGPGLATSLMIGASIAKGLAIGLHKPYLAINHLEGHLLSPFFDSLGEIERNISLVVSGGHTLLVDVNGVGDYRVLGRTVDDAAGEAFDKVAKMLGLGYPGGPEIEQHARRGDPGRFDFPRSMMDSGDDNFSFSGLKTAVRYTLAKLNAPNEQLIADLCASFQAAVIEVLVRKTIATAKARKVSLVTLSGGVSCNNELRTRMKSECDRAGLKFLSAPSALTTDNAAMIAFAALRRFQNGLRSEVTEEIDPNLALA
jgi:N6-L-threonylcarbamoyladenine synthase